MPESVLSATHSSIDASTYGHPDTCVIVPMFNEAPVIHDVVAELSQCFAYLVCVDDGSSDDSASQALAAGATVVQHPINLGQGAALQTGIAFALKDESLKYFITFDADGQHVVGDAERLLAEARSSGVDVILGSRFLTPDATIPRARRLVLRGAVAFTNLTTGMRLTDAHNGLRVLNRRAAARIDLRLAGMAHASEILDQIRRHKLSCKEQGVSIRYTEYSRAKGQSNLNAFNIAFDVLAERVRG